MCDYTQEVQKEMKRHRKCCISRSICRDLFLAVHSISITEHLLTVCQVLSERGWIQQRATQARLLLLWGGPLEW